MTDRAAESKPPTICDSRGWHVRSGVGSDTGHVAWDYHCAECGIELRDLATDLGHVPTRSEASFRASLDDRRKPARPR